MSQLMGPVYSITDHAGFIRRTCALAIDCAIIMILSLILVAIAIAFGPDKADAYLTFLFLCGALAYMLGFRMTPRGTPGYRIMRIRYAYMLGDSPTVLTVMYRSFLSVVFLMFLALDHIWILFDEHKQTWHDKVSGFYVVKSRAEPIGTTPMVRRFISILAMPFFVWEPLNEKHIIPRQRTFCPKCGYNLTGNVSGTCPECGQRVGGPAGRSG